MIRHQVPDTSDRKVSKVHLVIKAGRMGASQHGDEEFIGTKKGMVRIPLGGCYSDSLARPQKNWEDRIKKLLSKEI